MRRQLQYLTQNNFRGGINQEPSSGMANQVLDARNVYINDRGDLAKRPGFRFADRLTPALFSATILGTNPVYAIGNANLASLLASPLTVFQLNTWRLGEYFYVGTDTDFTGQDIFFLHLALVGPLTQSNTVFSELSYWNGSRWQETESVTYNTFDATNQVYFWEDGADTIGFMAATPVTMATTIVGGASKYWFRFRATGADSNWSGTVSVASSTGIRSGALARSVASLHSVETTTEKLRVSGVLASGTGNFFISARNGEYSTFSNQRLAQPSTIAVVPEQDKIFLAYNNQIYDVGQTAVTEATVNTDPELLGEVSGVQEEVLFDADTIGQLDEFPKADYILYSRGHLWCAGLEDRPFEVRWSTPALAGTTEIWPEVSFEILSEDDNSPIMGLATLNEHPVVFKRDSIWIMRYTGFNELGLAQFSPTKLVSGIGTVSQASIQNVNGRLIFLAEDGFYVFDGTPNVQKISDQIDAQVGRILEQRKSFATAVHWRTKNLYLCAVSVDTSNENDFVFAYDYKNGGWWFWEGLPVQSWLKEEGRFDRETISFGDTAGRILELTDNRRTDAGRDISWSVLPGRMGYGDGVTKRFRDFRVWGNSSGQDVTLERIVLDESHGTQPVTFADATEAKFDTAIWDTNTWVKEKRRTRKSRIRETGEWMQPKISGSGDGPVEIYGISVGTTSLGIR